MAHAFRETNTFQKNMNLCVCVSVYEFCSFQHVRDKMQAYNIPSLRNLYIFSKKLCPVATNTQTENVGMHAVKCALVYYRG